MFAIWVTRAVWLHERLLVVVVVVVVDVVVLVGGVVVCQFVIVAVVVGDWPLLLFLILMFVWLFAVIVFVVDIVA